MNKAFALALVLLVGACGDDPPPPPAKPGQTGGGGGGGAGGKPADNKNKLQARVHVEDRVACPLPDKPSETSCKPDAPTCDPGKSCLEINKQWSCVPCPERDSIRHEFKDRDFVAGQVRDPFQSFIILQKGLESAPDARREAGPCNRPDQFIASNYSYLDLRLVGIIAKGTQRKVLMMDRSNLGHIIKRGDCVGKEKAVVKDIGTGYVTFVVQPEIEDNKTTRAPEERSMQLHPKGLQVAPQPQAGDPSAAPTAPIVAPGAAPAPAPAPVVPPPTR